MVELDIKPTGLLEKIAQPLVDWWRGYSREDLAAAARIYQGSISNDDRTSYLEKKEADLYQTHCADPFQRSNERLPLTDAATSLYKEKVTALYSLTPAQLDAEIKSLVEHNLRNWGKLKF